MNEAKHPLIKLIFYLKRPKIVIVTGQGYQEAREAIFQVLSKNIKGVKKVKNLSVLDIFQNNVLIFESDLKQIDLKDLIYFLKNSILPVLVITQAGEFHPDKEFFAGDIKDVKEAREIAELLPSHSFLILNYDDETVREIDILTKAHSLNFGVGARVDVKATDIVISQRVVDGKIQRGLNFKVNHKGSIVPVWLNNIFGRKQIYASLAAASCGMVMDLNLIDVSRGLKSYNSIKGKMRLIKGVKSSWILDGTDNASPLSMAESLEVLKRIEAPRKIAVIGDILGIGKYTPLKLTNQ
ncbi:MAG: hypothetical protein CMI54_06695 [Parcubacteria group bacterium]|nr:hypothetical protein [Parcubacteria group bacterium]|tara:strand:- start:57375 stop:58262 length:888 start_codon:yes stop_codon:yes gene_type:complete